MRGWEGALRRYRVMAFVVGVGLLVLCLIGIPFQLAGTPVVVEIVGPVHGYLYIVYLVFALDLARRAKFTPAQLVAMLCAGLLPLLAFYVEHKVMGWARVRTWQLAQEQAAGRPAVS